MSIGLDAVNLEQAVRDADVSRSSAYAAWANDEYSPQESFQRSVLMHAMDDRKVSLDALTKNSAALFEKLHGTVPMRELIREVIREAAGSNIEATTHSMGWKLAIALGAALHSAPEDQRDQELVDWMNESAASLRTYTVERMYKPLSMAMGLKPRPQYGERAYELSEVCITTISDGFSMQYWRESREFIDGLEYHAIEGGKANWSMYAMLVEQVVMMFFIPESGSWEDLE